MKQHIDKERLQDNLTGEELAHLADCPFCREALLYHVEQHQLIQAPKHLKASVLTRSRQPDIRFIAGTNQVSRRLQLFYFSLKVSAAVLCALTLLTAAPALSSRLETRSDKQLSYYERIDNLTSQLNRLSNTNLEEIHYDKEKK